MIKENPENHQYRRSYCGTGRARRAGEAFLEEGGQSEKGSV
jgi:hypothetical protein